MPIKWKTEDHLVSEMFVHLDDEVDEIEVVRLGVDDDDKVETDIDDEVVDDVCLDDDEVELLDDDETHLLDMVEVDDHLMTQT